MKRIITLIAILLCALNSHSQEFSTHWISYPIPNDSSEVLFSQVYITKKRPKQASISFASSGKLKVYVNERNISQDIYFINPQSSAICIYTYDITRFLRPDSNTIAVWYAPQENVAVSKQLSLEYYGYDDKGSPFYHKADGNWRCKLLEGCYVKGNKETFDSRNYDCLWKSSDYSRDEWANSLGSFHTMPPYNVVKNEFYQKCPYIQHIANPVTTYKDQEGLHYAFEEKFSGTPRITLREAKKGETLLIDGFKYICNGELDEQAFRRFTTIKQRTISITGDSKFTSQQITHVEGLDIK